MSFLGEIKRRKVFQVAAVYAVVAWLIIQIIDVVSEPLSLPDWLDTVVIVLLAVGFPIAVVLAWAFDLTPDGVVRDQGTNVVPQSSRRRIEYVLIGLLVVAVGWIGFRELNPPGPGTVQSLPKVAVLPCDNLSPDPDDAYFAAGIHEEILNQLAKLSGLLVVARTSVLQYAEERPAIPQIASELNAQAVMECSVRYAGDSILVTAQLIDPETDAHLWSETYPGNLSDLSSIFAMQADIAVNIARALEAELLPTELQRIARAPTNSPEALALYLKARASVFEPSPVTDPDLAEEIYDLLDQAIALDENFAYAHAYKAMHYGVSTQGVLRVDDPLSRTDREALTRRHAQAALDIDPNVGLAYSALARMNESFLREAEALENYRRAYALTPNQPDLLIDYSGFSGRSDRVDDSVRMARQLAEVSPGYGHWVYGIILCWVGRCDDAIAPLYEAVSLIPDFHGTHELIAIAEAVRGNDAIALVSLRVAENLWGDDFIAPLYLAQAIHTYGAIGQADDARRVFERLEEMSTEYTVGYATWALAYLGLGDRERALEWLERAADSTMPDESFLVRFFIRSNLYADPALETAEFVDVRDRLGYPE